MINKSIVQKIRDQEMDRKTFLKYSGLMLVGLVGLRGAVALLTGADTHQNMASQSNLETSKANPRGFGGGKYGV